MYTSQDPQETGQSKLEGAREHLHAENEWALRPSEWPRVWDQLWVTGGQTMEPGMGTSHPCLDRKGPLSSQHSVTQFLTGQPFSPSLLPCPEALAFQPEGEQRGNLRKRQERVSLQERWRNYHFFPHYWLIRQDRDSNSFEPCLSCSQLSHLRTKNASFLPCGRKHGLALFSVTRQKVCETVIDIGIKLS